MKTKQVKKNIKISLKNIKKPWSRLSKIEKRKEIAKDVIFNIKSKIILADTSSYCSLNIEGGWDLSGKEFQQALGQKNSCNACAMGAMMASDIIKRNNFNDGSWNDTKIISRFHGLFSEFQLRLIETAFEMFVVCGVGNKLTDYLDAFDKQDNLTDIAIKAIRFGRKYNNENNRLIAIMNNIIDSKEGLFLDAK